jgi:hypothetical protein
LALNIVGIWFPLVKFNIVAECDGDTDDDRELNGMTVVVRNEKVRKPDGVGEIDLREW